MKRVLIFYISEFSGHFHAARAIEKGLLTLGQELEIKMVNAFEYTNPLLGRVINRAYMEVIKKKPELWGNMYDNPAVMERTKKARATLHKFNMPKMKRLLEGFAPEIVYCTQAFPCGMVADYKKACGSNMRLVGVLTDHAPHSYWLYDEVDYYVVPSEETARILMGKGIPENKIKPYGIPVDPKFRNRHDKNSLCGDLGMDKDKPIILIMGGSQGLGVMEDIVTSFLEDSRHEYQLIVVTGSNRKLYARLNKINRKSPLGLMKVLPFADNIDELMEISDIIITKAGGMTTTEALVKGLPLVIVEPIPGHERMNTDHLVRMGVAVEVKDYHNIYESVNRLFDSADLLDDMKRNINKIARPNSATDIAELIFT